MKKTSWIFYNKKKHFICKLLAPLPLSHKKMLSFSFCSMKATRPKLRKKSVLFIIFLLYCHYPMENSSELFFNFQNYRTICEILQMVAKTLLLHEEKKKETLLETFRYFYRIKTCFFLCLNLIQLLFFVLVVHVRIQRNKSQWCKTFWWVY